MIDPKLSQIPAARTKQRQKWALFIPLLFCVICQCEGIQGADENPGVTNRERVINAWKSRQARVRTLEFNWKQDREGWNRWSNYQSTWRSRNPHQMILPENRLLIRKDRARYETNRWYHRIDMEYAGFNFTRGWDAVLLRPEPIHRLHFHEPSSVIFHRTRNNQFSNPREQSLDAWRLTSLYDGEQWTDLFQKPADDTGGKVQSASNEKYHSEAVIRGISSDGPTFPQIMEDLYYRAILQTYRPFEPVLGGVHPERWEDLESGHQVDGYDCLLIRESATNNRQTLYFVDPLRDFSIVRTVFRVDGTTRAQLDVRYQEDLKQGWVPSAWLVLLYSEHKEFPGQNILLNFAAAKVESYSFNNSFPEEDFEREPFPTETLVLDQIHDQVYMTRPRGKIRVVTAAEMLESDATFFEVLKTETGRAPRRSTDFTPAKWFMILAAATFVLAICHTVWKRWTRTTTSAVNVKINK